MLHYRNMRRFTAAALCAAAWFAVAATAHAQTWLMLYAWCAATRAGYVGSFEAFDLELLHYAELTPDGELLEDDDEPDNDEAETIHPTVPDPPTS